MTVNVIKLNKAIEVGTVIPMNQYNGNIGRWAEDDIEDKGYPVNRKKGIDLPGYGLELKTRMENSTSGHTVGAMLPEDIVQQEWKAGNNIFNKVQRQYRVYYKVNDLTGENIVTRAQVYDFTDEEIQAKLKESWDHCRGYLVENPGHTPQYIRGKDHWAYLELQPNGTYQFRITHKYMKEMERISDFNRSKLFSIG